MNKINYPVSPSDISESCLEKRHIGVYGILQKENQILLVLKTRGPYTGKFDLPGGGIHHGEGLEEALRRELNEEVGLSLHIGQIAFYDALTAVTQYVENQLPISFYHIGLIYKVSGFTEEALSLSIQQEDVQGAKWVDLSIDREELSPFALKIINAI